LAKEKKDMKFSLSGSFKKTREYVDTRLKLFQLKLTERSSRLIASLLVDAVKAVLVLFVVFFFSLALGFYLSELLGSTALGFLTTGGIFILLFLLILLVEPRLEHFLMNLSIKRFLDKWYENEEPENVNEHTDEVKQKHEEGTQNK